MDMRPALLNSDITLNNIPHGFRETSEIVSTIRAIDKLSQLHQALQAATKTISPHETPEGRAMRYEKQYNDAMAKAEQVANAAAERIASLTDLADRMALDQSGLTKPPSNQEEIRAALRGMKPAERERAIQGAFEAGDVDVLASIYEQSPITWGGTKSPLETQFKLFVDEAEPQAITGREAASKALEGLELAAGAFIDDAKEWRQAHLATRGQKQLDDFE